ncbi:MAG: hypothetical protein EKK41_15585 [Hyphomicrobiales bacterium]|nr:MAG: hypothetical protein EKK41_15585 [Hyphomicrobiales bacterium]
MRREDAIAIIERALPTADDATLAAAAEVLLAGGGEAAQLPRALSDQELRLIELARADFASGRHLSLAESRAFVDEALERRRAGRKDE